MEWHGVLAKPILLLSSSPVFSSALRWEWLSVHINIIPHRPITIHADTVAHMIYVADPLSYVRTFPFLCGAKPPPDLYWITSYACVSQYPHTCTHIILPKDLSAVILLRARLASPPPSHVTDKTATHKALAVNHYGLMAACGLATSEINMHRNRCDDYALHNIHIFSGCIFVVVSHKCFAYKQKLMTFKCHLLSYYFQSLSQLCIICIQYCTLL